MTSMQYADDLYTKSSKAIDASQKSSYSDIFDDGSTLFLYRSLR